MEFVIKCGGVCYHMYPRRILMYPVCIPMYFAVFRWIHKNGRILMSPMCIPKTSNMSWVRFCIRLYSDVSRMYSTCTLDVFHMYPDHVQDTLAYKQDTSGYMQDTLGYKNGHVFQALGRVRSRAQLNAHRIRLEYIGIRSGYARICIPQQIAESEAEYDGIRVEYVTIRKESAENAQLLALSTEGQCLKDLLVARVELLGDAEKVDILLD